MFKILIDAYGGDNGAETVISAALISLSKNSNLILEIVGKIEELQKLLEGKTYDKQRLILTDARDVITCNEAPVEAIRSKKNSSLVVCIDKLKTGEYAGMISAGSTGAVLSGAVLKLGRLPGVSRPALAPMLPTITGGKVLLIDCGANVDCKPVNLCHFALMGSEYMKVTQNIAQPRVALLNVGTEDAKGNDLVKSSFEMLQKLPINFVGNMEARDALSGDYDVIVTDGFAGNVLLKSTEGAMKQIMKVLKQAMFTNLKSKIGALLLKKSLKTTLKRYDYEAYGGSPLLGTKQLIVKSHGSSNASQIVSSIEQIKSFSENGLLQKLKDAMTAFGELQLEQATDASATTTTDDNAEQQQDIK